MTLMKKVVKSNNIESIIFDHDDYGSYTVKSENRIAKCSKITTDGAAAMVGIPNGAVAIIKEKAVDCTSSIHR